MLIGFPIHTLPLPIQTVLSIIFSEHFKTFLIFPDWVGIRDKKSLKSCQRDARSTSQQETHQLLRTTPASHVTPK